MSPTDPSDPLLDALLADPGAHDAMHSAGLAALRRRRRWHRARLVAASSAAAAACLLFALRTPRDEREKDSPVAPPVLAKTASTVPAAAQPAVPELDDDELLRQFPPGTCTIAEVDGRKMLVFLTAEARAKYLR